MSLGFGWMSSQWTGLYTEYCFQVTELRGRREEWKGGLNERKNGERRSLKVGKKGKGEMKWGVFYATGCNLRRSSLLPHSILLLLFLSFSLHAFSSAFYFSFILFPFQTFLGPEKERFSQESWTERIAREKRRLRKGSRWWGGSEERRREEGEMNVEVEEKNLPAIV